MNKFPKLVLAIIFVSLFSYSIVYACSTPPPIIVVKCGGLETTIIAFEPYLTNDTEEDHQKRVEAKTIENLHTVSQNCKEDLSPVLETFKNEIILWLRKDKRMFLDRDLILEPYSVERDNEIQKNEQNLFSCEYEEVQHVGNWLVVFKTGRPYCYEDWNVPGGMCPGIAMSLRGFILYLVTNISFTTLPYLAGWLIVSTAIIYAWLIVLKNQTAMNWQKLLVVSLVILVVMLFLMSSPSWILGQVIGWVLACGLVALWYKQRKSASKQKTG